MNDYYKELGLSPGASQEEIKKRFRKMALKYHPDRGEKSDEEKFKRINEAYSILGDPQKRKQYDFQKTNPQGFQGFNGFNDIWSDFFGDFGDIFGNSNKKKHRKPEPRVRLDIAISDLESGELVQEFTRNYEEDCPDCNGTGGEGITVCKDCDGRGQVAVVQQVGTMRIQNVVNCPTCRGRGKIFASPCRTCKTSGLVRKSKTYRVKINTEIVA